MDMTDHATLVASAPGALPQPATKLICVIGTTDAMDRAGGDLSVLVNDADVELLNWRLDEDFGEPPAAADWADGLVILNADAWAAPSGCARLQALLKMAWRCGRTVALCGEAVSSLAVLGFARDVPAEAEGLFLCPDGMCRETLREFMDAVQDQPHRNR